MMQMKKRSGTRCVLMVALIVFCLVNSSILVSASSGVSIPIIGSADIPADLNLNSSATATDHTSFDQAVAQEDGSFAICSRFTESSRDAFTLVYVDVYQPDGSFWKEISFTTQFQVSIELKDNCINLYFYDYVVKYSLATDEVFCYEIEANSLRESGLYGDLHQSTFQSGEWEYRCVSSFWGYTQLTRFNGIDEQVLVSYQGMDSIFIGIILAVALVTLCMVILVRKMRRAK